jgi:CYTH domain-containing protein
MTPGDRGHSDRSPSDKDISAARRFYGRVSAFSETRALSRSRVNGTSTRYEFEYEIPKNEAIEIITRFSFEPIIAKTRYEVLYEGVLWVVDGV